MTEFANTPEDRVIMEALSVNRERQVRAAIEAEHTYSRQLGTMAIEETFESQLAGIVLDYQAEREQLPQPGDSKKALEEKKLRRMTWSIESGIFTIVGADQWSGLGTGRGELVIFHQEDKVSEPPLLFEPEADARSGLRQGWTVGYSSDMSRHKSPTSSKQRRINPSKRRVELEIGFAARPAEDEITLTYKALYRVIAARAENKPDKLEVTQDDVPVTGDDLLFPMGLVLQATRELKTRSPYSETSEEVKRAHRYKKFDLAPYELWSWLTKKVAKKPTKQSPRRPII